ncbi:interferon-induced GTP-binding protein Mx [Metarhizium album ARSEF 1941]|uniref:Interferon-induced GTP-binding protein Mx n=1 Tax=Metarhizium album (strain ARSEF 1941) TaxID=1081103 RepID=A0A0B2X5S6_METAS|nr:interferon-induced GTP-binding protein Mx [Metarhizium album ARSEF 1941]KHO00775.1 interferon-induced GTP-binding protein Mx [Metarhizium album ARSEF 1941]
MAIVDLQSRDHKSLLDLIDTLRGKGVARYVPLPEIVVVGDQSAGKSSVLEAISGMSFPAKDNLCTRFATELVLRRSTNVEVKISILPETSRPMRQQEELKRFRPVVEPGTLDLSHIVEQAKLAMGITPTSKAFRNDTLRVELSGPDQPHLTMVDLPGLFQAGNSLQSDQDSETVTNMAIKYMKLPRSIILAVVSAKSDFALQQVTRLARGYDPNGHRTIGLITKPDTLDEGSESEAAYIRLARNDDVKLKLGWHVLKNRDYKMTQNKATSKERDDAEKAFFSSGPWATLDPSTVGVKTLKPRLSNLLRDQIVLQLPGLVKDVESGIKKCKRQIEKLGSPRESIVEQREYLISVSQTFSDLMKAAVNGNYTDAFFGSSKSEEGYQKRLRAVIQSLLTEIKDEMNENGCTRQIVDPEDQPDDESTILSDNQVLRSAYMEDVSKLMDRNRGCELPGTFNHLIPARSQQRAAAVESTAKRLGRFIRPAIDDLGKDLEASFQDLLRPYQNIHAITYNEALTAHVQKAQAERRRRNLKARLDESYPVEIAGSQRLTVSRQAILDMFKATEDADMKSHASSLAVDYLEAYYNVSLKKFIDDISTLGVECCLMQKLRTVFDPREIYKMSDAVLQQLAAEDPDEKLERSRLKEKLSVLDSCLAEVVSIVYKKADQKGKAQ